MPGPGNYESVRKPTGEQVWRPKVEIVRMPSEDKFRGTIPGKPILEADGSQRKAMNPAALDSIRREEGPNATETKVTLYPKTRDRDNIEAIAVLKEEIKKLQLQQKINP
jgi:hypothetical protein